MCLVVVSEILFFLKILSYLVESRLISSIMSCSLFYKTLKKIKGLTTK